MRAPSSLNSNAAGVACSSASPTLVAVCANIGLMGRNSWIENGARPAAPSVSAALATAPRLPDSIAARRKSAAGSSAALATASTMIPSSAPCRSSPVKSRNRKFCSSGVARKKRAPSSLFFVAAEPLPEVFATRSSVASISLISIVGVCAACPLAAWSVAQPTPTLAWRIVPDRYAIAISISSCCARFKRSASWRTFARRPDVEATWCDVLTRSWRSTKEPRGYIVLAIQVVTESSMLEPCYREPRSTISAPRTITSFPAVRCARWCMPSSSSAAPPASTSKAPSCRLSHSSCWTLGCGSCSPSPSRLARKVLQHRRSLLESDLAVDFQHLVVRPAAADDLPKLGTDDHLLVEIHVILCNAMSVVATRAVLIVRHRVERVDFRTGRAANRVDLQQARRRFEALALVRLWRFHLEEKLRAIFGAEIQIRDAASLTGSSAPRLQNAGNELRK